MIGKNATLHSLSVKILRCVLFVTLSTSQSDMKRKLGKDFKI